jgi:polyribonucleotide nucleotidyltransferase
VLAAIASFAAVALSSLPHGETLGMVRVGCIDGKLSINPLWTDIQSDKNKLNLTVAGHKDAVAMVEAGAEEVSEELMLQALELAHDTCKQIAEMIDELVQKAGKPKMAFTPPVHDPELVRRSRTSSAASCAPPRSPRAASRSAAPRPRPPRRRRARSSTRRPARRRRSRRRGTPRSAPS